MQQNDAHSCDACPLGEVVARRRFLRDVLWSVAAAVGALGVLPRHGKALPITFASGVGTRADKAYPLPAANAVVIDKDESVILARFDERVYAFSLACPHQNTAIRWDASNTRFQCPKHKSRYRTDGTFIEGRATRGLDRFAVKREGDRILVNLDLLYREDKNTTEWAAAFIPLTEK
jgi:nitrite reductase/ring-hydroxylating ferredoxin subunit